MQSSLFILPSSSEWGQTFHRTPPRFPHRGVGPARRVGRSAGAPPFTMRKEGLIVPARR